ncbi:MAG: cytochrome b [Pseudomonadota bacterium]
MSAKPTYSGIDRINHWIVAIAVIGMIIAGWALSLDMIDKEAARGVRNTHKGIGILILIFAVWRVGWRLITGFPEAVAGIAAWQAKASKIAHYVLMACLFLMPITGILNGYFGGRTAKVFGLFQIDPAPVKVPDMKELFSNAHMVIGIVLTLIVLVHVAAALKHHFVDKDGVLRRMTSGG